MASEDLAKAYIKLRRNDTVRRRIASDPDRALANFSLTSDERRALIADAAKPKWEPGIAKKPGSTVALLRAGFANLSPDTQSSLTPQSSSSSICGPCTCYDPEEDEDWPCPGGILRC